MMRITRFIFYLCCIAFLGSLFSCTGKSTKYAIPDLAEIKARGYLTGITDYNSTNYFIYKGTPMGFQYELLKLFADHLGVTLELKAETDLDKIFKLLTTGEVDVIAMNLTVTRSRRKTINFTVPIYQTRQVLVQRKPKGWETMNDYELSKALLRNQLDLKGKSVYIQEHSSHSERLKNLSSEIGDSIDIVEVPMSVEELIKVVASGDILYSVCDENVAMVNRYYFPEIDIETPLSFQQNIAWAVNFKSPQLLNELNKWLDGFRKTLRYQLLYSKYFVNRKVSIHVASEYYAITTGKISPYDEYIRKYSQQIGWDWRLLASLIYQESKFNPNVISWAGAIGLMQLMPSTAQKFGAKAILSPEDNIAAGVRFLAWLDNNLKDKVSDKNERIKFILASYNVGLGHILDARRLAEKYGKDPAVWTDNVDFFLLNKSKPGYYTDQVVSHGYCRGEEPYFYVIEVMERFKHYCNLVKDDEPK